MKETELRQKLIKHAKDSGYWAKSVNDRFMSGYPDMRLKVPNYPHIDIELKILDSTISALRRRVEVNSGIEALQAIELREMNLHGIPAVGMVYISAIDKFVFTNKRRFVPLLEADLDVVEGNKGKPNLVSVVNTAYRYLRRIGFEYDRAKD